MVRQSNHESGNAVIWSSDGLSNPNRAEVAAYRIMGPLRPCDIAQTTRPS